MRIPYEIRLDNKYHYLDDVHGMIIGLKNMAHRQGSVIHVDVMLRPADELRLTMRPKDLYLVGFVAKNGKSYYTEDNNVLEDQGKEYFSESGDYKKLRFEEVAPFNIHSFDSYFKNLQNYSGSDRDSVRKSFAIMCVLVSESVRFYQKVVINIFCRKFFSTDIVPPKEILKWAQNWEKLSVNNIARVSCKHYNYLS
ncbi:ribosome-inactivating family protein [Microbulbifer sp. OS29]|uniref:Ribosome-inactivating family protein n=1 Tax=Microbulbifer okhotskensis TaxID=2926617 RepID=A0A9X2J5W2_9GAMM|nr:ribosome-inactivating family protein [Microbulbifer okhotskensis]MCO1335982.1 ribosome-inactivating family protein [Microbulbifer okhotskensis]